MKRSLIAAAACALALAPAMASAQEPISAAVDAARLAAARITVDYFFPSGTYARIMDKSLDGAMGRMMDGIGKMPLRDLAAAAGVPQDKLAKLGDGTLTEIMAIYDPHYRERMELTTRAMTGELSKLVTQFEPAIRDGLAHAYARRFSVGELGELNRFFATPTGKAFAADSFVIFTDPEVMDKMTELMPAMMKQMPAMTQKLQQAVAKLPPPRKLEDLSSADRARLAQLLGIPADELGRPRDNGLVEVK